VSCFDWVDVEFHEFFFRADGQRYYLGICL